MPTSVNRRPGVFPVRVSLNVTVETSEVVDYLEQTTGEYRGVIVREALNMGLAVYQRVIRRRQRRERKADRAAARLSLTTPPDTKGEMVSAPRAGLVSGLFPDGAGKPLDPRRLS